MSSAADPMRRPLILKASDIARVHTYLAFSAFLTALFLGSVLHYKKIVKNGIAGYPQEWFPSVSATIGDWYPERSIFHILIALNSGPRFALVFLQYFLRRDSATSSLPLVVFLSGLVRTVACGGWVYITSEDDHDAHDILMISYIVCNIPWMFGGLACTPREHVTQRNRRKLLAALFFASIVPMIHFFVQHKVHGVPGAYTRYAFFEWGLIFTDILFDAVAELDFAHANLQIGVVTNDRRTTSIPLDDDHGVDQAVSRLDEGEGSKNLKESMHEKKTATSEVDPSSAAAHMPYWNIFKAIGPQLLAKLRPTLSFLADLYLAFIFWSIYTSLLPTLFYFSVWELGIAGAELALLAILSPALLGIEPFRQWAAGRAGRATLYALSLSGIVAFKLPKPFQRLLLVTFATFFACIGTAIGWTGENTNVHHESIFLGLGLLMSSLSKHANHSNNPVWPMLDEHSGGYNKSGLFLAILAVWELFSRPVCSRKNVGQSSVRGTARKGESNLEGNGSGLSASLPLASLLFGLHVFLTDPSTLIAWTWTGYPIRGPIPHLHGFLTLLAQSLGVLISTFSCSTLIVTSNPAWYCFGIVSSYVLYSYDNWRGYSGGLGLAVFLMSILSQVMQTASNAKNIGRTYLTIFIVVIFLHLGSVWTVAYAFVPGGDYLRERTDIVLLIQMALLAPAFNWRPKSGLSTNTAAALPPRTLMHVCGAVAVMVSVAGILQVYRTAGNTPQPYQPGPRILRAGIWTVHFGMDNEGRDSQRGMRDLIQDMQLDVVGLLETDLHRPAFGNRDLSRVLVEDLGYFVDSGPGPNRHTWGAVLLSKFPIINSTHHLLPSPDGELAPAISAFLDVWGMKVHVVVAHNGQEETPLDRELQSKELARIMNSTFPDPVIFLGYVVTKPHAPSPAPYSILVEDGRVHDIDALDFDRWCEYIFYRGLYRTSYLRMSRGKLTDTELQVGQFVVPRFGTHVTDDSEDARYLRRNKEALPIEHWFPMEYYGNERDGGKNGHFYHVFNTPLYYGIPAGAIL